MYNFSFNLKDQIDDPWHDYEKLYLAGWVPSPVKAAFICNKITGYEIDGHCENGPPVLTAINETFPRVEPAWAIAEIRSQLPADQED